MIHHPYLNLIHILLLPYPNKPSSSTNHINGHLSNTRPRFTFQSPSTPERTSVTTHPYTQAQNTSDPHIPTTFNIIMIPTNPSPNIVTSRTLSRPPLERIPNNPLQCNLSSTNIHNTQRPLHTLEPNAQIISSNNSVQHHNGSNIIKFLYSNANKY